MSASLETDEALRLAKKIIEDATKIFMNNLPSIMKGVENIVDVVFVPKVVARQLALAVVLETGALAMDQIFKILRAVASNFSTRSRLIRELTRRQAKAETQDEWMGLAEQIDNIQGHDAWRSEPTCALYESDRISSRVDEFVHLMRRKDVFELMFTLRGGIGRNNFGLLHEGLFSKAMAGSKVLVETYHNVVCAALDFVCDSPVPPGDEPIPTEARLAFFNETRHSYGRSALLLSGGAALGFYHVGVVKALLENGLLPRVLGGSSAGSIVSAMIATRTDEEIKRDLYEVRGTVAPGHSGILKLDFFRPLGSKLSSHQNTNAGDLGEVLSNTAGAFQDIKKTFQLLFPIRLRMLTSIIYDILTGHKRPQDLLKNDTEHFRSCCEANIGNFTFQEAFDRTGRIVNIIVSPQNRSDPPRLLNYLTAPHVLVWTAAVASSSLPGVFEPNKLLVKDADGTIRYENASARFQDGSMENDLPMQQLSEMFNVNHFIISQANPHAVMFASFGIDMSVWTNPFVGAMHGVLLFLKDQVREWIRGMVELVGGRRIAPLWDTRRSVFSQFFTQEYEGRENDISLIPWINHRSLFSALLHCIYNPGNDEFLQWTKAAERETWKNIPQIKSHVAEEITLDRCVQRLRKRILAESRAAKHTSSGGLLPNTGAESTSDKMGNRVPSFFTSPSLVNMGGLNVGDGFNINETVPDSSTTPAEPLRPATATSQYVELRSGWGGMGLRGNHSSGSLANSGSGLFFMDGSDDEQSSSGDQVAGELPSVPKPKSLNDFHEPQEGGYIKTSSMANFYYRKVASQGNLASSKEMPMSRPGLERGKSKSTMDLASK